MSATSNSNYKNGKERHYFIVQKRIRKYPNNGRKLLFDKPAYFYSAHVTYIDLPVDQL
ncbi:hypothetical protein [Sulfurovum sp. NBC37-1]|uniref:hypothetical protein n=1 Tax=Sulfurovum sp. (strain NBC37-1) TaxID=387093 RepID=UPI0003099BB0|nr:hypothetical protein [Sulfurovum sp. NBC37-1]